MAKNKSFENSGFIPNENPKAVKEDKKDTAKKKKENKNKKPNFFKRMGSKIKDMFSELKKVNWPTFGKVVKETGIVLVVVIIFLVIITAFDAGLFELLKLVV